MNITFGFNIFRWRITTFDIRIDLDPDLAAATSPVVDGYVKRVSRRWVRHMAS